MIRVFGDYRELSILSEIKCALALLTAGLLDVVGHPDSAALGLFYLMLVDLALGMARAWKTHTFKSARITRGAFKFFRYWLIVAIFVWVDEAILRAFPPMPLSMRDTFIAYLAVNEAFSCVDHMAFFGMPVPEPFLKRLRHYHDALWDGAERRSLPPSGGGDGK